MKKQKHDYGAAQRFIAAFLPEGKITRGSYQELRQIEGLAAALLVGGTVRLSLDALFKAFETLHYPIAVQEPAFAGTLQGPYKQTNSNRIFIGVDQLGVEKLKDFLHLQRTGKKAHTAIGRELSHNLSVFT